MAGMVDNILGWVSKLTEVGVSLIALAVIVQIIFGPSVAFLPGDIVGNIIGLVS